MGYYTYFEITISAATPERKREIAKRVIALARLGTTSRNEVLTEFEKEGSLSFVAQWGDWKHDVQGSWYDRTTRSVREGLHLEEGESLNIEGSGEEDRDMWRAVVTRRKFSIERCLRAEFINKQSPCENDETEPDPCTGCSACAERVPVYE